VINVLKKSVIFLLNHIVCVCVHCIQVCLLRLMCAARVSGEVAAAILSAGAKPCYYPHYPTNLIPVSGHLQSTARGESSTGLVAPDSVLKDYAEEI
jgi:hypothetical protein